MLTSCEKGTNGRTEKNRTFETRLVCVLRGLDQTEKHSHVKAQVLLLLKEVVQDVLPDKVWV